MGCGPEVTMGERSAAVGEITALLTRPGAQSPEVEERLISLMYPELKRIAEARMRHERGDHTLQPTGLVNEFYLHFARMQGLNWRSRAHFLAVASNAMRRVLVDYARAKRSDKRGGGQTVQLQSVDPGTGDTAIEVLEIHLLLEQLAEQDARMARVVELRYFGGLTNQEVSEVLDVDERTVRRDWQVARAWLYDHLKKGS